MGLASGLITIGSAVASCDGPPLQDTSPQSPTRLLLIERDAPLGRGIDQWLRDQGYVTDWVQDVDSALTAMCGTTYDLLILDVGFPASAGLPMLEKLRAQLGGARLLILSAGEPSTRRADDDLAMPFDLEELTAHVRAILSRRLTSG